MAKAKYDYIKLRVDEAERAMLEGMVKAGQAPTLSDAARKLAFAEKANFDLAESVTQYLQEIAQIHLEMRPLIFNQLENRALLENDLMQLERQVAELAKSAAKLSKAVRKGL